MNLKQRLCEKVFLQTVNFTKPKMASNNHTFDSQDELITQADQRLQWEKLTIEALQHQIPLQVIPISSPINQAYHTLEQ